jgi:IS5 family transposase
LLLADLQPGLVFLWRHNSVHSHILDKLAIMIGDVPYRRDGKRTEPRNVRMFAGTLRRPDRRSPASHNRWFVQSDKQSR